MKNYVCLHWETIWISLPSWAKQYQYAELKNQGEIGDRFKVEVFFFQFSFSLSLRVAYVFAGLTGPGSNNKGLTVYRINFTKKRIVAESWHGTSFSSSWPGIGQKTWAIWGKEAACSVTQLSLMQTAGIGIGMFVCLYVWLFIIKTKKKLGRVGTCQ